MWWKPDRLHIYIQNAILQLVIFHVFTYFLYGHFFHSLVHNVFDLILHTVKLQFQQVPQGGALAHHKPDLWKGLHGSHEGDHILRSG